MMLLLAAFALWHTPSAAPALKGEGPRFHVKFEPVDAEWGAKFKRFAESSEKLVAGFFGRPFAKDVTLYLCPDRAALDRAFKKEWNEPKTESWMIGAAGAERAFFLSPRVWKQEAPEHNPLDEVAIERVVAHELTHSYHSQNNPRKDMNGMEPMAWLVEGLATYVSGQESGNHRGQAASILKSGGFPADLEAVWKGRARYGLAGSLVRFIDEKYGRRALIGLLPATTSAEALKKLGATEKTLIGGWKAWLAGNAADTSKP